ncbi:MAG: HlyD family efflux transporter periplasmic adaptor subunit [Bacteroidetes bacterium]|nr:HlyD family efflux transporter periplasmic adaptor subunit [Bacteroidota bacterium]
MEVFENKELDHMRISRLLYDNRHIKKLTVWLLIILAIIFGAMFLPWQQNVTGYGSVTAFTPEDRPQKVYANVPGRIIDWAVIEGDLVEEGDTLVRIAEIKDEYFDPDILDRKQKQLASQEASIAQLFDKVKALDKQIDALEIGLVTTLNKTRNKLKDARYKVTIDSADLAAANLNYQTAQEQYSRGKGLYDEGLISLTKYENLRVKMQETQAKAQAAENKLRISRNQYLNAILEITSVEADYNDKISKAISNKNSTLSYINEAENKLTKMQIETTNLSLRQSYYVVRAPRRGYVIRAIKTGIGEILKENDPLMTIMPTNPQMAAEVYVEAMDVVLLTKGDKVRIRFDGWPALVFSGWPNASLGTFGGIVQVIDNVNTYDNKYRLLVVPDKEDIPWPEELRLGSGVYGWAMLKDVPVWFELWRQLNGFPPMPTHEQKVSSSELNGNPKKYK